MVLRLDIWCNLRLCKILGRLCKICSIKDSNILELIAKFYKRFKHFRTNYYMSVLAVNSAQFVSRESAQAAGEAQDVPIQISQHCKKDKKTKRQKARKKDKKAKVQVFLNWAQGH